MPRPRRITLPGYPHHVTQRGNRKTNVFLDDSDRHVYLKMLVEQCLELSIRIWAYCLMDNHVHIIVVPDREDSLSRAFQRIHSSYATYFNLKYAKAGHLWQGRFKCAVMDSRHLWNGVRYVERNPVRAGIVAHAQDFHWSSAASHCGLRSDSVLSNDLPLLKEISDWNSWLHESESQTELNFIRKRTHSCRPCADNEFLRKMEIQFGRKLLLQKCGRKKKHDTTGTK
jgi:putative transposase